MEHPEPILTQFLHENEDPKVRWSKMDILDPALHKLKIDKVLPQCPRDRTETDEPMDKKFKIDTSFPPNRAYCP
jgi:hypothetical protein